MRNDSLSKYKNNLRIFSILIIVICLIMTTITSVGFYISPVQSEIEESIKNIVLNDEMKLDKAPEMKLEKSSGVIWTTRIDCGNITQNVNQYCYEEIVYINGDKFQPNTLLYWNITGSPNSGDPNSQVDSGSVMSDDFGAFCFSNYTINNNDYGVYFVNVDGKSDNYRVVSCDDVDGDG
ncbi:MAG: hypothetical protein KAJ21_04635, partial [Thermoplasmatales archaeon]|nr:hypothetical protein [Thermoplasmatales archaeon]